MLVPKIAWNDGTAHTLTPSYPPVQKPGVDERSVVRLDSIAVAGQKQSAYQRTDIFRTLQFDHVPFSDMTMADGWVTFLAYAETGASFTYYPDSTVSGTHDDWTLEDTDWLPTYVTHSFAKFKIKLRKLVS